MSTAYGDPNSDVAYTWSDDAATDYTRIDDGVRQPSAPSTGGDGQYCYCSPNDDNELASFGCTQPSISGTVTQVTAWAFMEWQNSGGTMALGAYFNGSTQTASNKSVTNSQNWYSTVYSSLSIPAASLFPWRINLQPGTVGKSDDVFVYGAYLEVTYTAGGGGGGSNNGGFLIFSGFIQRNNLFLPKRKKLIIPGEVPNLKRYLYGK